MFSKTKENQRFVFRDDFGDELVAVAAIAAVAEARSPGGSRGRSRRGSRSRRSRRGSRRAHLPRDDNEAVDVVILLVVILR